MKINLGPNSSSIHFYGNGGGGGEGGGDYHRSIDGFYIFSIVSDDENNDITDCSMRDLHKAVMEEERSPICLNGLTVSYFWKSSSDHTFVLKVCTSDAVIDVSKSWHLTINIAESDPNSSEPFVFTDWAVKNIALT